MPLTSLAAVVALAIGAATNSVLSRAALLANKRLRSRALATKVLSGTAAIAGLGGSIRALLAPMALLVAATARALGLRRVGALGLVVSTMKCQSRVNVKEGVARSSYPSSPQL